MGWLSSLREVLRRSGLLGRSLPPRSKLPEEGHAPYALDAQAAIGELTKLAESRSDSVEIYLALGNLFRSQGEIEKAVAARRILIERFSHESGHGRPLTDSDDSKLSRVWFELGRDYRRGGFLDRARQAFETARDLAGDDPTILSELARLALDSGDTSSAARWYAELGHAPAQAHCLVIEAQRLVDEGKAGDAERALRDAFEVHPGSAEGHRLAVRLAAGKSAEQMRSALGEAMSKVEPRLRFVVLDDLLGVIGDDADKARIAASALASLTPDVLLLYYGGLFLLAAGEREEAGALFEKSVVMNTDFWPSRLETLGLASDARDLSPVLHDQLTFFVARARELKKFACRSCGLKQGQIFFVCPRCQSWHSIAFRMSLND